MARTQTTNGAGAHTTTGNKLVDLFFNIGASRANPEGIRKDFKAAFSNDPLKATAILLYARDIRHNGMGERQVFRTLLKDLVAMSAAYATKTMYLIPEIARFDDLKTLYGTVLEQSAAQIWVNAIKEKNVLAAKWAKREDKVLQKAFGLNEANLRKLLSGIRSQHIVEAKMCAQNWTGIDFSKLPSVAGMRYAKAFGRNDGIRYSAFMESKETKVNASVAFPYDVFTMWAAGAGSNEVNKYWDNLKDLELAGNILPIVDTSDSMTWFKVAGTLNPRDVALGLGVYMAQKVQGKFANMFMTFDQAPQVVHIPKGDVTKAFQTARGMRVGGNTNIEAVYDKILDMAQNMSAKQSDLPDYIAIFSDMQFDQASGQSGYYYGGKAVKVETIQENMKKKFAAAGFKLPKIIYWNLNAGNGNVPTTKFEKDVALVSGFSPNVMKAVLSAKAFTPEGVMMEAITPFIEMLLQ